jgi:S-adenosylmethionine:tRNA ribosyltransferase-isomerase
MTDFELKNYDFDIPQELIADRPVPDRHSSKLMVFFEETGEVAHSTFADLPQFLPPETTLIFNRSRVFPCRLLGKKLTGGEAEVFVLSLLDSGGVFPVLIRASGKRKEGDGFEFGPLRCVIEKVCGDGTFLVRFNQEREELIHWLQEIGKIPIPPYIRNGESDEQDKTSYQTVYAKEVGSVAAPTAGLHFSQELLERLKKNGHELATVLLHVGAGTFAPVKAQNILEHKMHEEFYTIDQQNLGIIQKAKFRLAVGTTTLRVLESVWDGQNINIKNPGQMQSTSIFLYPGQPVHSIDALITNFHLPQSTLVMLVSSLIGREKTLELYRLAIEKRYRFFSYGDGMLILRKKQ